MIYAIDITKNNISKAISFCLPHEEYSVNLISFLKQEEKNFLRNINNAKLFFAEKKIIGVACINKHNFFLYCFNLCNEEVYNLIISTFNFNLIYAIMGEASFQKQLLIYLLKTSNIRIKTSSLCILMIKLKTQTTLNCPLLMHNIKITKANVKDAHNLLDLQVGYENEEVCQTKNEFPRCISFMNLEHILKDEITYFARINNLCVAKANTNAQGINYNQIGGVYTLPKYRGRGIASNVVNALIEHINKREGKNATLFVKMDNTKAIKMYKKLGLKERCEFCISYLK